MFLQTVEDLSGGQEWCILKQILDEVFKGLQLAFPAKYLAGKHTLELLLAHTLIPADCIATDAEFQCNLHLTEGLSG